MCRTYGAQIFSPDNSTNISLLTELRSKVDPVRYAKVVVNHVAKFTHAALDENGSRSQ